ncbi:hypothetical protein [Rhodococcus ruber]|uniref:hypothetical protein n=1 Tax=Rhodococcus ruber TaxID=1830 RepID=UPI003D813DE3
MSDPRLMMKKVHDQLLAIRDARGELTPQIVVDEARVETHPLHSRFEWDDAVAGEAYRRVQAAELIRSVKVVYLETPEGDRRSVRAWSSLHEHETPDQRGYIPTQEVLQDEFTRKLLLRQCEREIRDLRRKYGHLEEFAELIAAAVKAS